MKRYRNSTAVIIASIALASCGVSPEQQFERAQQSYAAHAYSRARLDLSSALKQKPDDPAMLELLARTQIELGDGNGALATLDRLSAATDVPDLALLRAEAELLRGRFDAVLQIVKGRDNASADRLAALAYIGLGKIDQAEEALKAGLLRSEGQAELLATFARFELGRGNVEQARKLAEQSRRADDQLLDARLVSAEVAISLNRLPDALADYEFAHRTYPESFAALTGRAAVLGDLGRLADAAVLIEQAAKVDPDHPRVVHLQARLAVERKDWHGARAMLQSQEAAVRANPAMQVTYATALLNLGQSEQAQAWLRPLVSRYPSMRAPRSLLAQAQLAGGDGAAALATIRPLAERPDASPLELDIAAKAARIAGDPATGRYAKRARLPAPEWLGGELAKADTALRNQQWSKAVASYELIVERTATPNAMVLNNLAYAKSQAGDKRGATDIALKALKLAPDHASIMDTAGWLLVETNRDRKRGIDLLKRASELEPDNVGISRRLAAAQRG